MGAKRQRILPRVASLEAQIAEIHAACLGTDEALVENRHPCAASRQEIRRPDAHEAAADDRDIGGPDAHPSAVPPGGAGRGEMSDPPIAME